MQNEAMHIRIFRFAHKPLTKIAKKIKSQFTGMHRANRTEKCSTRRYIDDALVFFLFSFFSRFSGWQLLRKLFSCIQRARVLFFFFVGSTVVYERGIS